MSVHFIVKKCCEANLCHDGLGVVEPADLPDNVPSTWDGPVIETITAPERVEPLRLLDLRVAIHEAAHAAVAHALGWRILLARAAVPARVTFAPRPVDVTPKGLEHSLLVTLAGDVAADWQGRIVHRPNDHDLLPYLKAAIKMTGGRCDRCHAMTTSIMLSLQLQEDPDATVPTDDEILAAYRRVELRVIEMIQTPRIWRAVTDLAEQLMIHGQITGDDVHDIIEPHVALGSFNF